MSDITSFPRPWRGGALLLALAVVALTMADGASAEEGWLEDPIGGCQVWAPGSVAGDVITWTGDCVDGKAAGEGFAAWFSDGQLKARFEGIMEGGKVDGYGKLVFGMADGFEHYEGEFKAGDLHGQGTYIDAAGNLYQGDFAADEPDGFGIFEGADGTYYQGEFKAGLPDGQGTLLEPDGTQYEGQFAGGVRSGEGEQIEPDGTRYVGTFEDDLPDGSGRVELPDGGIYEGEVRAGKLQGAGTYTAPEGDVYVGAFVDDWPDGTIQVTKSDGSQEEQLWQDGEQVP